MAAAATDEAAEVAALDRVLTRTVLTKDEDLQTLLVKLLPALVTKLSTTQPKTRAKVLELLNHINKRVKALPATALPLLPLVQLAVQDASPMVRSFALVYVEMGVARSPPAEQLQAVPLLLSGLSQRAPQHQAVALRVVTHCLSNLTPAPGGSYSHVTVTNNNSTTSSSSSKTVINAVSLLPPNAADRSAFLRHALKLLLYQRPSSGRGGQLQTPLGLANAAAAAANAVAAGSGSNAATAAAAAAATADALRAQPGLSAADVAALEEKGVPEQEVLIKQKLGLLCLLAAAAAGMPGNSSAATTTPSAAAAATTAGSGSNATATEGGEGMDVDAPAAATTATPATATAAAAGDDPAAVAPHCLTSEELLLPLLAASCDPYEAVARRGGDLLIKLINPDAARPAVNLEQPALVEALMGLLLGDQDPRCPQPAPQPAGPALAVRIMTLLVRSVAAASIFPGAPLVMHACLTGPSSSPRLVRLGAEWTGWVFKHAPPHQLKAMGGPVAHRLLTALGLSDDESDTTAAADGGDTHMADASATSAAAGAAMAAAGGSSGGGSSGGALAALSGSAEARGHVFSALAQLANRMPDLFKDNTHLASRLFAALSVEPPGSRTALQEALGAMAGALAGGIQQQGFGTAAAAAGAAGAGAAGGAGGAASVEEIEKLLLSSVGSKQAAVRLCAAQWASRLFPRSHMTSRYVLMLAAGDTKPEVRDVGLTGLGLHPSQLHPTMTPSAYRAAVVGSGGVSGGSGGSGSTAAAAGGGGGAAAGADKQQQGRNVWPAPGVVIADVVSRHRQLGTAGDLSRPLPLPDASCQALIAFIKAAATAAAAASNVSANNSSSTVIAEQQQQSAYDPAAHALLLENLACRGAGRDTAAAALEGLVGLVGGTAEWIRGEEGQTAAAALRKRYSGRQLWLSHWLSHNHLPVRAAAAQLTALAASGLLLTDSDAGTTAAAAPAAGAGVADGLMQQLLDAMPAVGGVGVGGSGSSSSSSRLLEEQEGSMLAVGLLVARAHTEASASSSSPKKSPQLLLLSAATQQAAVAALHQQLSHHTGGLRACSGSSGSNAEPPVGSSGTSGARSLVLAGAAALALGYCGLVGVQLPGLETPQEPAPEAAAAVSASSNGSSNGSSVEQPPPPLLQLLFALCSSKDGRAVLRAVTAVGYIGAGCGGSSGSDIGEALRLAAAKGLLKVVSAKGVSEEVLLAAGEAAAATAGDIDGFDPHMLLWSTYDSIADVVDAATPTATPPTQQQDAMQVDATAGAAGNAASAAVQSFLLQELCSSLCVSPREEVRCAGVVLLVSLLQLCSGSSVVREALPRLQRTFTGLLGDSNDLTQDLAARGVSLVYSRGGSGLQQQLLGQLLGLLSGTGAAPAAGGPGAAAAGAAGVQLAPDSKLFEEGQLGNTPGGGGLTTYRELCSLANEMGQPDLIYRFMDLARASSALTAKRGAAVGVARIARLAATAAGGEEGGGGLASLLGPERLAALLPKLYRLTHDPSPKVSDSMSAIWTALLDDPRVALDTHFDAIAKSLLSDMGGRLWRVRQSAAAALTDLLSGRRWGQLAPHMEQMWMMALRAFDDVKESVRAAAAGLLRSLRGLSLRLMDRQQTPAADVAACCQVVLPLLAGSQGLGSGVEEVRAVSTDVLCSGIKTAGPAQVLPVLPVVVPVLLEALSGLEDARLNYVEQHAERVGIDVEKLAAARLAAARSSALSEALDACCRSLTGPAAADMAPGLASLIRRGVGLNTKAGTARFVKGLAARLGQDLKPAAPTLLKPLVAAVSNESSGQVKKAYAAAAAALAVRCVGDKRQEKFVSDALASYGAAAVPLQPVDTSAAGAAGGGGNGSQQQQGFAVPMSGVQEAASTASGNDDSARQAGGLLLRELLRESGDTFSKYASQILPVAFIASHDESTSVAAAWTPVWSEGCPSEPAALRLHASELAGLIAGGLASSSWGRKRSAAKALIVLSSVAPDQLSPYSPPLSAQLLQEGAEGRLWEGKEGLLAALGALGAHCTATLCVVPGLPTLLRGLLSAAARKKSVFRAAALAALQQVLDALPPLCSAAAAAATTTTTAAAGGGVAVVDGVAVWRVVSPPMLEALQQQLEAATTTKPSTAAEGGAGGGGTAATTAADSTANGGSSEEVKPLPLVEVCNCLKYAWAVLPPSEQQTAAASQQQGSASSSQQQGLVTLLLGLLTASGFSWSTWLAVVQLTGALVASACSTAATAAGGGSSGTGSSGSSDRSVYVVALVPLAGGLVHVVQHSTISQLRLKCLETLLQLLQLIQQDPTATAAWLQQPATATTGAAAAAGGLSALVSGCLSDVAANDPSVAHKSLAASAAAVVAQMSGGA